MPKESSLLPQVTSHFRRTGAVPWKTNFWDFLKANSVSLEESQNPGGQESHASFIDPKPGLGRLRKSLRMGWVEPKWEKTSTLYIYIYVYMCVCDYMWIETAHPNRVHLSISFGGSLFVVSNDKQVDIVPPRTWYHPNTGPSFCCSVGRFMLSPLEDDD